MPQQISKVMPPYFYIRIPKKAQRERMEKIGVLYYPPEFVYMKRGMQCGEIVLIGEAAHKYFPEAQTGNILIFHHVTEGKQDGKGNKIFQLDEDENWNYYVITAFCHNGDRNQTFGVWDGTQIIPNKDYVFFEIEKDPESDMPNFDIEAKGFANFVTNIAFQETSTGLVIPKPKKKSREELTRKMKENVDEIKKLSRWLQIAPEKVTDQIRSLEKDNLIISKEINTVRYETHTLHSFNNELRNEIHPDLKKGDKVFALNIACHMRVEFMGIEYIVSESKYISLKDQ